MVDVSVVIVNYNAFDFLKKCVASLREHTKDVSYEIIIIDNCSTEGDILEHIKESDDLHIIKNTVNRGFGAANNKGAELAKGRYILYLNNDTLFLEDTLSILVKHSDSLKEEQLLGCKVLNSDMTLQESIFLFPTVSHIFFESIYLAKLFPRSSFFNFFAPSYYQGSQPIETDVVKGCFIFLSASANKRLKGFDEDFYFYSEETDLCRRFQLKIGKVIYFPLTKIIHHGEVSTGSYSWFKFQNVAESRIVLFKKWFTGIRFPLVLISQYIGYFIRSVVNLLAGMLTLNEQLFMRGWFFLKMLFIYPKGKYRIQE